MTCEEDSGVSQGVLKAEFANSSPQGDVVTVPRGQLRHIWEIPLLVCSIVVSVFFYGATLILIGMGAISMFSLVIVAIPLIVFVYRGVMWGKSQSMMVPMTPEQFPDGWMMVQEISRSFGVKPPEAYVVSGAGSVQAYASGHQFRRFVVVSSDLFEVGGKLRSPEALEWVLSHEIGHIAAGHTSFWRIVSSYVAMYIPILGPALSRAQEYTADSYACSRCPHGTHSAMGVLMGGKYLVDHIDVGHVCDMSQKNSVWVAMNNLVSSHPVTVWRAIHALDKNSSPPKRGSLFLPPDTQKRTQGNVKKGTED